VYKASLSIIQDIATSFWCPQLYTTRISTISLIPTRSRCGRRVDAKTRPKFSEELNRNSLGHDVHEPVRGRDMKDPKLSQCHLLTDEVNVNLNMLRAPMVNKCFQLILYVSILWTLSFYSFEMKFFIAGISPTVSLKKTMWTRRGERGVPATASGSSYTQRQCEQ
jgi:hypothetical protein